MYNKGRCDDNGYIADCFPAHSHICYGTLSHSHLLLVLRSWINAAKWDLRDQNDMPHLCDQSGHLSLHLAARNENTKELVEVCNEGMMFEVLSWKMMVEEPDAANVISNALNLGNEAALRTTELTALAVLCTEVTCMKEQSLSEQVRFDTVIRKVRAQLDVMVDEPEFIELFEFCINLGANCSPFCPDLLNFAQYFVDQKKRQLRLHAFTMANQLPTECPLIKIAVIKRAYRKPPSHGYCPAPESLWGKMEINMLTDLEKLLRYFHVVCSDLVAQKSPKQSALFLANVDVAATEAFIASPVSKRRQGMIAATSKHYFDLERAGKEAEEGFTMPYLAAGAEWMQFEKKQEEQAQAAPVLLPRVLSFDRDGGVRCQQETRAHEEVQKESKTLPWQAWLNTSVKERTNAKDCFKSAALLVLGMLHNCPAVAAQPVKLEIGGQGNPGVRALAARVIPEGSLFLPPCVHKASRLVETSDHPGRMTLCVKAVGSTKEADKGKAAASDAVAAIASEEYNFFALPEFKAPDFVGKDEKAGMESIQWHWKGEETMHPCWAVRRLTAAQAQKEGLSINCHVITKNFTSVVIGAIADGSETMTVSVEVPIIANDREVKAGEEFILEVMSKAAPPRKRVENWKDDAKRATKRPKAGATVAAPTTI
jgi:hypothetical protein